MTDLSSCYFCGTAIEAPVREYPVVPEDVGGADGPTVALCPTCRRKHRAVVGAVLSTLEGEDPGDLATVEVTAGAGRDGADSSGPDGGGDARGGGSRDRAANGPDDGTPAESATAAGADPGADDDPGTDPDDDGPGEATGEDASAGTPGTSAAAGSPGADADGETPTADPDGESATADADGDTPDGGDADPGVESDISGDPEPIFSDSTPAGASDDGEDGRVFSASTPVGGGAGEVDPSDSVGEAALSEDEEETDAPDVDVSTPPHSKVVRQLQNREFPVDREEIVTVAVGAYGLAESDATAALDALVAQGVLREEDGSLHRGEDRTGPS